MLQCACGSQKAACRSQSTSTCQAWQQAPVLYHQPPKHLHWEDSNISCSEPSLVLDPGNLHMAAFVHWGSFQTSLTVNAHVNNE